MRWEESGGSKGALVDVANGLAEKRVGGVGRSCRTRLGNVCFCRSNVNGLGRGAARAVAACTLSSTSRKESSSARIVLSFSLSRPLGRVVGWSMPAKVL